MLGSSCSPCCSSCSDEQVASIYAMLRGSSITATLSTSGYVTQMAGTVIGDADAHKSLRVFMPAAQTAPDMRNAIKDVLRQQLGLGDCEAFAAESLPDGAVSLVADLSGFVAASSPPAFTYEDEDTKWTVTLHLASDASTSSDKFPGTNCALHASVTATRKRKKCTYKLADVSRLTGDITFRDRLFSTERTQAMAQARSYSDVIGYVASPYTWAPNSSSAGYSLETREQPGGTWATPIVDPAGYDVTPQIYTADAGIKGLYAEAIKPSATSWGSYAVPVFVTTSRDATTVTPTAGGLRMDLYEYQRSDASTFTITDQQPSGSAWTALSGAVDFTFGGTEANPDRFTAYASAGGKWFSRTTPRTFASQVSLAITLP